MRNKVLYECLIPGLHFIICLKCDTTNKNNSKISCQEIYFSISIFHYIFIAILFQ